MISRTINTTIESKLQDFLPASIKKYWVAKQQVYISTSQNAILIKKLAKPQLLYHKSGRDFKVASSNSNCNKKFLSKISLKQSNGLAEKVKSCR